VQRVSSPWFPRMSIGESGNSVAACLESFNEEMPLLSVRIFLRFHLSNRAIAVEHYDRSLYRASIGPYHFHFKLKVRSERRQADILIFNLLPFLQTYDLWLFGVAEIGQKDARIWAEITIRAYQSHT
jgi:hypothetical protein